MIYKFTLLSLVVPLTGCYKARDSHVYDYPSFVKRVSNKKYMIRNKDFASCLAGLRYDWFCRTMNEPASSGAIPRHRTALSEFDFFRSLLNLFTRSFSVPSSDHISAFGRKNFLPSVSLKPTLRDIVKPTSGPAQVYTVRVLCRRNLIIA